MCGKCSFIAVLPASLTLYSFQSGAFSRNSLAKRGEARWRSNVKVLLLALSLPMVFAHQFPPHGARRHAGKTKCEGAEWPVFCQSVRIKNPPNPSLQGGTTLWQPIRLLIDHCSPLTPALSQREREQKYFWGHSFWAAFC